MKKTSYYAITEKLHYGQLRFRFASIRTQLIHKMEN